MYQHVSTSCRSNWERRWRLVLLRLLSFPPVNTHRCWKHPFFNSIRGILRLIVKPFTGCDQLLQIRATFCQYRSITLLMASVEAKINSIECLRKQVEKHRLMINGVASLLMTRVKAKINSVASSTSGGKCRSKDQ